MKILTVIILTLALAFTVAGQKSLTDIQGAIPSLKYSGNFSAVYDRFDDITKVTFKNVDIDGTPAPDTLRIAGQFTFKGQTLAPISSMDLAFVSTNDRWVFLNRHTLDALIDGERIHLGDGYHSGKLASPGVIEVVSFSIPLATYSKLANGKSVELRLGGVEMTLTAEHQQMLKDLISLASVK